MKDRKVIQMIVLPESEDSTKQIHVLCDDGSMWCRYSQEDFFRMQDVPLGSDELFGRLQPA